MTQVMWFRADLRVSDNAALTIAANQGQVLPVYILEDCKEMRAIGGASRWWLHHSLQRLKSRLGRLVILSGDPREVLSNLARQIGADAVHWNSRYDLPGQDLDRQVAERLAELGIPVQAHFSGLLAEPGKILNQSGSAFKVYTPFWKRLKAGAIAEPFPEPAISLCHVAEIGQSIDRLKLLPDGKNWHEGWAKFWVPGEKGAKERLAQFLDERLMGYAVGRDRPDQVFVSRLSPHLRFGEISPAQIWAATKFTMTRNPELEEDGWKFLSELGWREFSYHLLHHFPSIPEKNWKAGFDQYPWQQNEKQLRAWQQGRTGYPLVDAGMRELWQTGYMHNRVRMVVASFLVKHLRIDWREGESWFWDTLVDADQANNACSWQWVAGCGADAAPYFRIFNPTGQAEKFDPKGDYIRQWCPELAQLTNKQIHAPFEASPMELAMANVRLGENYPEPIVDHKKAREAALAGYEAVRQT